MKNANALGVTTDINCQHATTEVLATVPFSGAVSYTENPAAHGGVRVTVRCTKCGALRSENRNGKHVEASNWSAR